MLEARQGAAYTGENMTSPESPAILYEHADGRRAVVSANRLATFAIDNPDWHRAGPVEIVWVDETAPAWRPIETAPQPAVQQGDDLQTFAIVDSNYAAGMLLGWNLCTAGMDAEFSRIREDRMRAAVQASRAAHPAAPVAQGDAWRDLLWQIADALECTPCAADEVLPKVQAIAEDAARLDWLDKACAGAIRLDDRAGLVPRYAYWGATQEAQSARAAIDAARSQAKEGA